MTGHRLSTYYIIGEHYDCFKERNCHFAIYFSRHRD